MNRVKSASSRAVRRQASTSTAMLAFLLTFTVTAQAMGNAGRPDNTFGDMGVVLLPGGGVVNETALQSDGKLVSAASLPGRLIRHNSDGSIDTYFGGGTGYVAAPGEAVTLQSDGKLVAADSVSVGYPRTAFRVQRFNQDGSIDATFGDNGTAIAEFESILEPISIHGYDVTVSDVAVQDNGKILLVGTYNYYHYDGFSYSKRQIAQALARFNSDGSADTGFGDLGKRVNDTVSDADPANNPRESVKSVVLQSDGRIVVGGYLENNDLDMMVTRYNSDGSLDSQFGINGVTSFDLGGFDTGWDLTIQPDGNIILVGRRELSGFSSADVALLRLYSNGAVDSGFGYGGVTITDYQGLQDGANAVALQQDGKIVIGGFVTETVRHDVINMAMGVIRYNSDGTLDESFGRKGVAVTSINEGLGDRANDVLIQLDGKIIASGSALIRYLP